MADLSDICAHTLGVGPHRPNWSIITAAPVTSQVIGVLGGLVFTGIILLLQQTPDHGDTMRYRYSMRAMNTLIYVFFALMLTSFFFSSIAGEQLCGRAFAEGTLAAALFAIGAGDTFLSICWLFAVHRIGGEQVGWVKAITAVVMFAAWINMALTIYDAVLAVDVAGRFVW